MEIRIGKEWVIYASKNGSNIILSKVPDALQDSHDPLDPIKLGQKYYYSTIFGAIQGVFKLGVFASDARSFLELEKEIYRISKLCEDAFKEAKADAEG